MRRSLRLKVALGLFAAAIVLLVAQAIGVRALAEAQEERLIQAIIEDDMRNLVSTYRADPASLPPPDPELHLRVSRERGVTTRFPAWCASLPLGVHEVMVDGREVHVAVAMFGSERLFRLYDFSVYELQFRDSLNLLLGGTALFVLPSMWLAYALSGFLVRQVAGLAQQIRDLRAGTVSAIDSARYDEREVAELGEAINDYHRRMAAMVAREKEFAGNVSHELRTPLTAIRTSCELLEPVAASLDAKSRQRLHQVERAAADMQALTECLLALAREDSPEELASVALAPLIEAALERFADRLEAKSIRRAVQVPAAIRVRANPAALGMVLSNLVDNALRHTEHGTIQFSYRDGCLQVEDSGSGIAPDALPHVFERHYRVPGARPDGYGIGLAIVKRICERYGWPILVDSGEGTGTRVVLGLEQDSDPGSAGKAPAGAAGRIGGFA
jgi:signal transduction histidine kinase